MEEVDIEIEAFMLDFQKINIITRCLNCNNFVGTKCKLKDMNMLETDSCHEFEPGTNAKLLIRTYYERYKGYDRREPRGQGIYAHA